MGFLTSYNTNAKDVCQSLLTFTQTLKANRYPLTGMPTEWYNGVARVMQIAMGNGAHSAALKYDAANFARLIMDGYIDSYEELAPEAERILGSLRLRCHRLGIELPALPSTSGQ
jgi:hypothetical protein